MISEKLKQRLASKNNNLDSLKKEKIIRKVKKQYPHVEDEIAILRKMVFILANKVKEQHSDIDLTELMSYNLFVESCKDEANKELEI